MRKTLIRLFCCSLLVAVAPVPAEALDYLQACKQSREAWTRLVRTKLNAAKNPLADRAKELNWDSYCTCYAAEMKTLTRQPRKNPQDFQEREAKATVDCAGKAGFVKLPAVPKLSKGEPTPFFSAAEKNCREGTTGRLILIESHLSTTQSPRLDRARSLNLADYCSCYFRSLREILGDELAERSEQYATKTPLSADELMRASNASADSTDICVAQQLSFTATGGERTGSSKNFESVFASEFQLGKGLGGVEVGMRIEDALAKLGPTNAVTKSKSYDEYRFGPTLLELIVRSAPSGDNGRVTWVQVNRFYGGKTNNGIRIGEVFESVLQKMGPTPKPYASDRYNGLLIFPNGVQFTFGMYNAGTVQSIVAFDPKHHPLFPKSN